MQPCYLLLILAQLARKRTELITRGDRTWLKARKCSQALELNWLNPQSFDKPNAFSRCYVIMYNVLLSGSIMDDDIKSEKYQSYQF